MVWPTLGLRTAKEQNSLSAKRLKLAYLITDFNTISVCDREMLDHNI